MFLEGLFVFGVFEVFFVCDGCYFIEGLGWFWFEGFWIIEGSEFCIEIEGVLNCEGIGFYIWIYEVLVLWFVVVEDDCCL